MKDEARKRSVRPVEPQAQRLPEGKQPPRPKAAAETDLTDWGFAVVRRNPKAQFIIEVATVSATKNEACTKANATDFDRPDYAKLYPQAGVIMVKISARIKA